MSASCEPNVLSCEFDGMEREIREFGGFQIRGEKADYQNKPSFGQRDRQSVRAQGGRCGDRTGVSSDDSNHTYRTK